MLPLLQVPVKKIFILIVSFWAGFSFLIHRKEPAGQDQRLHNGILRDCFVWPMPGFVHMFKTIKKN